MTALILVSVTLVGVTGTIVALTADPQRQAIVLAVFGLALTALFVVLQAPDVALSQLLIGGVVVPCGPEAMRTLSADGYAMHFITEAYKHLKAIGAFGAGVELLPQAGITERLAEDTTATVSTGVV